MGLLKEVQSSPDAFTIFSNVSKPSPWGTLSFLMASTILNNLTEGFLSRGEGDKVGEGEKG